MENWGTIIGKMRGDDKHLARDQSMHSKNLRVNLKNASRMYNLQTHANRGRGRWQKDIWIGKT